MNATVMLLFVMGLFQNVPQMRSFEVIGLVVRYDLYNSGVQADIVLKSTDEANQYLRLIYSPHSGFDAPPLRPEEVLPKDMFSDATLLWSFRVHKPGNEDERIACKSDPIGLRQDKKGNLETINRYHSLPGRESDVPPQIDKLPCFLVDSWKSAKSEE
jgi:hypothetical protein